MKSLLKKIDLYFISCSKIFLVLYPVFFSFSTSFIAAFTMTDTDNEKYANTGLLYSIIILTLTPLLETFLFQFLVFRLFLQKLGRRNTIVVSAVIFSAAHFHKFHIGLSYLTPIVLGGFLLAYVYSVGVIRKDINAFKLVTIVHFGYNFLIYAFSVLGVYFG